jgi:hypothetical protein
MDLLVTITGKVCNKVANRADVIKVGFVITTLFEVVYGCASHLIDRVVFMRLHSTRIGDEVHLPEATQPV